MKKKDSPMVVKVEMIVTNQELLEHGWTDKQRRKLHEALGDFLTSTISIWGQASTEYSTRLIPESESLKELDKIEGLPKASNGLSA